MNATGSHQAVVHLNYGYCDIINCTFVNCTTSYGALSNYYERNVIDVHMTVRNSTFKNNHATTEPGVINNCGQLVVYDSYFEGNSAAWWAGAIHTHTNANTTVIRSTFKNNVGGWDGGALYTYSILTVIDSNFTGNRASNGGAITASNYMGSRSYVTVINCEFDNNTAGGSGGAISFGGAELTIDGSKFYDNTATSGSGGAVSVGGVNAVISNCEFGNNEAISKNAKGGAVYWSSSNGRLVKSNFNNCSADNGGSVYWASANGKLSACTFTDSHADIDGGAIYWQSANGTVARSGFTDCSADNNGGGLYFSGANCTLINPVFEGCSAQEGPDWYSVEPLDVIYEKIPTVLTVPDVTTTYGVSANMTATLMDADDNCMPGEKITITLNDEDYELETDSKGYVTLPIPTDLAAKTYTATVIYGGNDDYQSASTTANVTVTKIPSAVYAEDISIDYGEDGVLIATVTINLTGKGLSNVKTVLTLNGEKYITKTNKQGEAQFNITGLAGGNYSAVVSYGGNTKYLKSNVTVNIEVVKIPIVISAEDVSVAYGENAIIIATLTNNVTGKAKTSANVVLTINDQKYKAKSDSNGQAIFDISGLKIGSYEAEISYGGNDKYLNASTTVNIEVTKTPIVISAEDVSVAYGEDAIIVATLTNNVTGKAKTSANVVLTINDQKYKAKSDSNGQAIFNITGLKIGSYEAVISYGGNDKYLNASTTVNVEVTEIPTAVSSIYDASTNGIIATDS